MPGEQGGLLVSGQQAAGIVPKNDIEICVGHAPFAQQIGKPGNDIAQRFVTGEKGRGGHLVPGRHGKGQARGRHGADAILRQAYLPYPSGEGRLAWIGIERS